MQIGFVGLGRMGLNMVTRLIRGGHEVVAFDRSADAVARAEAAGARGVASLEALVAALAVPRAVWVMVPAGNPTEATVNALAGLMATTTPSSRRQHQLSRRCAARRRCGDAPLDYIDAGTSGGIWGLQEGYCLMVGGEADVCKRLEPIFLTLAPPDGYLRVGDHGAGHYVKMIHNGIEYGLMQAYAEGFEVMHKSEYKIDLGAVATSGTTAASSAPGCWSWPRTRSPPSRPVRPEGLRRGFR